MEFWGQSFNSVEVYSMSSSKRSKNYITTYKTVCCLSGKTWSDHHIWKVWNVDVESFLIMWMFMLTVCWFCHSRAISAISAEIEVHQLWFVCSWEKIDLWSKTFINNLLTDFLPPINLLLKMSRTPDIREKFLLKSIKLTLSKKSMFMAGGYKAEMLFW